MPIFGIRRMTSSRTMNSSSRDDQKRRSFHLKWGSRKSRSDEVGNNSRNNSFASNASSSAASSVVSKDRTTKKKKAQAADRDVIVFPKSSQASVQTQPLSSFMEGINNGVGGFVDDYQEQVADDESYVFEDPQVINYNSSSDDDKHDNNNDEDEIRVQFDRHPIATQQQQQKQGEAVDGRQRSENNHHFERYSTDHEILVNTGFFEKYRVTVSEVSVDEGSVRLPPKQVVAATSPVMRAFSAPAPLDLIKQKYQADLRTVRKTQTAKTASEYQKQNRNGNHTNGIERFHSEVKIATVAPQFLTNNNNGSKMTMQVPSTPQKSSSDVLQSNISVLYQSIPLPKKSIPRTVIPGRSVFDYPNNNDDDEEEDGLSSSDNSPQPITPPAERDATTLENESAMLDRLVFSLRKLWDTKENNSPSSPEKKGSCVVVQADDDDDGGTADSSAPAKAIFIPSHLSPFSKCTSKDNKEDKLHRHIGEEMPDDEQEISLVTAATTSPKPTIVQQLQDLPPDRDVRTKMNHFYQQIHQNLTAAAQNKAFNNAAKEFENSNQRATQERSIDRQRTPERPIDEHPIPKSRCIEISLDDPPKYHGPREQMFRARSDVLDDEVDHEIEYLDENEVENGPFFECEEDWEEEELAKIDQRQQGETLRTEVIGELEEEDEGGFADDDSRTYDESLEYFKIVGVSKTATVVNLKHRLKFEEQKRLFEEEKREELLRLAEDRLRQEEFEKALEEAENRDTWKQVPRELNSWWKSAATWNPLCFMCTSSCAEINPIIQTTTGFDCSNLETVSLDAGEKPPLRSQLSSSPLPHNLQKRDSSSPSLSSGSSSFIRRLTTRTPLSSQRRPPPPVSSKKTVTWFPPARPPSTMDAHSINEVSI